MSTKRDTDVRTEGGNGDRGDRNGTGDTAVRDAA